MTDKLDGELGVVLARIEDLRIDVTEVKNNIITTCKLVNDFQLIYTREHAKLETITLEMLKDIAKHDVRLEVLEALIKPLVFQSKVIMWIGGIFAVSAFSLLFAIFTHQITLVFP